ncbi:cobQ/CobB/MinD/ParA nucleotide binding domain protein [Mycobacterium ulcerans str. Harvey]|uniref:CobQ/CobB/MinD/ParA nucleotide binding domain protein n=1 Tax=Mycobacterium ulcerans str. Harvey TaxID=1299332 RepID=A0ABP3AFY4_MYCUL|nr:cobQ/CobB/MinD/ParA nucleotide binding domain protein [Mycobacterium ulcerans str. Harvey]
MRVGTATRRYRWHFVHARTGCLGELNPRCGDRRPGIGQRKDHRGHGSDRSAPTSGPQGRPFKVGPDFIDPGYHALAAGRPGRNLDPVLVGERLIGPLYAHGAQGADIAVVEGVMGLFDGRIEHAVAGPATGSSAHVANLLGTPVILVVDARGQSHSIAALLHGFSTFDSKTRIAGVILNRVGSAAMSTFCGRRASKPVCRWWAPSRAVPSWSFRRGIWVWLPPSNMAVVPGWRSRR